MKKNICIPIILALCMLHALPKTIWAIDNTYIDKILYPESSKKISMDFYDARLSEVLKIISQQSEKNFIAAANVADRSINLYIEDVPVDEALDRILKANNLTYTYDSQSNIFVVKEELKPEVEIITRVYRLKYATVPSSKLNSTLSSSDEEDTVVDTNDGTSGIVAAIETFLTEAGSIVEDARTNSIIISDIPSQFPAIEETIARLDVRIPQVLIEVEMLDISKTSADLLGAKYGDTPFELVGGASKQSFFPFNTGSILDGETVFATDQYTAGSISFEGLKMTLNFLKTQSDTKNLARPRILTLNNETAEIQIKTDEAIGISAETTSAEGTASSVEEAERVETGVFLKVTPQANINTGEITLAIEPRVIQARTGQTFGTQTFKDPEERGTKSVLRVDDGDTVIIGGLLRTDIAEVQTNVPFFAKIPVLGAAFRHRDDTETQRELIIFITPHIIEENFKNDVASSNRRDVIREQDIPMDKLNEIEKELSYFEKQRF